MIEEFAYWCQGFGVGFGAGLILLTVVFPFQTVKRCLGEAASSS